MKADFIIKSPILIPGRLDENISRTIGICLRELSQLIKDNQVYGAHTGARRRSGAINGGVISHQASAVGESPAPDTFNLVNSNEIEQFSATTGEVRVTAVYAAILQNQMGRDVTKTPSELYQKIFLRKIETAVGELL